MNALLPLVADSVPTVETWQEGFLRMYRQVENHARHSFQHFPAEAREDAVSEVIASVMVAYRRLHERGELQRGNSVSLVRYAVRQFHDGRRVGSSQNCQDVNSPLARRKSSYEICSLGTPGGQIGAWLECLIDDHLTPVPDQVSFRIDFPRWLAGQSRRNQLIAERLSQGYAPSEVAAEFGVSRGRISQIRLELAESWRAFHEPKAEEPSA